MSILLNADLELRSGWRFAVYVAVFVVALYATGAGLSLLIPGPEVLTGQFALLGLTAASYGVPAAVALAFMIRFVDQVPVLTYGVGFHTRWLGDAGRGAAAGISMLALYSGGVVLTGTFRMRGPASEPSELAAAGAVGLILLVTAANEELIFRGYPLQALMAGIGIWPATVVMSALFAVGHLSNPNATWLGTANTFLAGILLCLAYVRTRSLWLPWGIHVGWNLGLGPIFGFPLSGLDLSSIWTVEVTGAGWVTGGDYGPEGGILVTGVMVAALAVVGFTRWVRVSPEVSALVDRHAGKVYRDSTLSSLGGS